MFLRRYPLILFLSLTLSLLFSRSALAQTLKNSIAVTPQLTQLDLTKDKAETQIYYTNNASVPVELSLHIEDVRELEDRSPVGILNPKEAENYKYSLSSWAFLSTQSLILKPGEKIPVTVTIQGDKLSPGGHYGTVLAEIRQSTNNKQDVQVRGVLASLLFVRASTGNQIEEAKISGFGPTNKGFTVPDEFSFRFQNTGNVDLTPYGLVVIKDSKGNLIAKGIVNEDSLITLPEAIRKYVVKVKPQQAVIMPGKYTALLQIHFGKSNKKAEIKSTFISAGNETFIGWLIGLLVVLILALGAFKLILKKITT